MDGLSALGLNSWRLGAPPAVLLPVGTDGAETDRAEKKATGSPGGTSVGVITGGCGPENEPLLRCGCTWLGVCGGFGAGADTFFALEVAVVTGTTISSGWPSSGTAKSASSKSIRLLAVDLERLGQTTYHRESRQMIQLLLTLALEVVPLQ